METDYVTNPDGLEGTLDRLLGDASNSSLDNEVDNYKIAARYLDNLKEERKENMVKEIEYRLYEILSQVLLRVEETELNYLYSALSNIRFRYPISKLLNYDTLVEIVSIHTDENTKKPNTALSRILNDASILFRLSEHTLLDNVWEKVYALQPSTDREHFKDLISTHHWVMILILAAMCFKNHFRYVLGTFLIYYSDKK